ncbi:MAG: hypothetical protein ACKOD7_06555 [Polynucleobacter victoriensis]
MERKDWTLSVYKRDLRCKSGERKVNEYRYNDWTQAQMAEETRDLRNTLYRAELGWRLEFAASWVKVNNIMTGKEVTIAADARGTCCDPSQERFWSM